MGFGSGFTEGLFGSVDRALQEEFRTAKAETSRLTSLRQARTAQRNDTREAKVEKTNEEIQALAGKIGPGAGIILNDFIQEGGLAYAKEATTKLLNYTQKTGITPVEFYKLSADELGKKPNAQFFNTLAQSAVPAVKPLPEPVTTAGGIAKYFGYGGPEAVKKQTEAAMASTGGTSVRDISGLGERRGGITDTAIPIQYSIKDEQIFNAKESISLTEKLTNPDITEEQRAELQGKLVAVNNKIAANREIQSILSPDKDVESQYFRLVNEGKTEEAEELLQVIIRFNTQTTPSTKTYGNSGTLTKAMVLGLPAFAAKKVGFDPLNPSRPVIRRVFNKATGGFISKEIPGEQAEKEYRMELLNGYVNYSNNLVIKANDADAVSMRGLLNKEIADLRVKLGMDTSNTTTNNMSAATNTNNVVSPTTFGSPSTKEDPNIVGSKSIPIQNRYTSADTIALPKGNTIGGAEGKGGSVIDLIDSYSAKFRIGSQQGRQKFIDSVKNNKGQAVAALIKRVEKQDKVTMSREIASMILDKIVDNIKDFKPRGTTEGDTISGIEPKVVSNRPSSMIRLPQ